MNNKKDLSSLVFLFTIYIKIRLMYNIIVRKVVIIMNKKEAIELAKFKKKNGIGRVGCQMSNGRDQLKITREKAEKILKKINE